MSALATTAYWPLPPGDALRSGTSAPGCVRPAGALACKTVQQARAPFGSSAGFQPAVSPVSNRRQAAPSPGILTTGVTGRLEAGDTADWKSALRGTATVCLVTALGLALGLAGGLVIANFTGDFILPPLLGASFGGAASTAIGD